MQIFRPKTLIVFLQFLVTANITMKNMWDLAQNVFKLFLGRRNRRIRVQIFSFELFEVIFCNKLPEKMSFISELSSFFSKTIIIIKTIARKKNENIFTLDLHTGRMRKHSQILEQTRSTKGEKIGIFSIAPEIQSLTASTLQLFT